jgi:hypothetical protein
LASPASTGTSPIPPTVVLSIDVAHPTTALSLSSPSKPFELIGLLKSVIVPSLDHQPLSDRVLDGVGVGISIGTASDVEQGRVGCEDEGLSGWRVGVRSSV